MADDFGFHRGHNDCKPCRLERLLSFLESTGLNFVLIANPATITWLLGEELQIDQYLLPWGWWPTLVVGVDGTAEIWMPAGESARLSAPEWSVIEYATAPGDPLATAELAAGRFESRFGRHVIGTDLGWAHIPFLEPLRWRNIGTELARLRIQKFPDEITQIKCALRLAEVALESARSEATYCASTDREIADVMLKSIQSASSERIPLTYYDVVVAPNINHFNGPPRGRSTGASKRLLVDFAVRYGGYWADIADTFASCNDSEYVEQRQRIEASLDSALANFGPGDAVEALDNALNIDGATPHHRLHGVGVTCFEAPTTPSDEFLTPGMVMCWEPGIYAADSGLRIEWMVLVSENGCRRLRPG